VEMLATNSHKLSMSSSRSSLYRKGKGEEIKRLEALGEAELGPFSSLLNVVGYFLRDFPI
jgi:hypothetical protein